MYRVLAVVCCLSTGATAQCEPSWASTMGMTGANGPVVAASFWDADGAGPAPARLVIGGAFTAVGSVAARGIAVHDAATGAWAELGGGVDGGVGALAAAPNGALVVGGSFAHAGTVPAANVAVWNGAWQPCGPGVDGYVQSALALPGGEIVVGGFFTSAGGSAANRVARWTGSAWQPMAGGLFAAPRCLVRSPSGDVIAASGPTIQSWNGTAWSQLAQAQGGVYALAFEPGGDLIAAGNFYSIGGVQPGRIARWNGAAWSAFPAGPNSEIDAIQLLGGGTFAISGVFSFSTPAGPLARNVAAWNGVAWEALGAGFAGPARALARSPAGELHVAGEPASSLDPTVPVARWDGTAWRGLGSGVDGEIEAVVRMPNGDVVIGGRFDHVGDAAAANVARWNGATWGPLGAGLDGRVEAMVALPNGDLVAGGSFQQSGSSPVPWLARWTGSAWVPFASTVPSGTVTTLLRTAAGHLFVGGGFTSVGSMPAGRVARWDGAGWSAVNAAFDGPVLALLETPLGIVAGGSFATNGAATVRRLARHDGTTWSEVGGGVGSSASVVQALAWTRGELVVAGAFAYVGGTAPAAGVASWDGTTWRDLAGGVPQASPTFAALATLPNDDVIAALDLPAGASASLQRLWRWNGAQWTPFANVTSGAVRALAATAGPRLQVAGMRLVAGALAVGGLGELAPGCAASASSYGSGCVGSAGTVQLAAANAPFAGTTFRATTTLPANAPLAVAVWGFAPLAVPIAALLPEGGPGCDLLVVPALLDAVLPAGGVAETRLVIPSTPALAGQQVRHQVAPFEIDGTGAVAAITSSNALLLTVGAF